MRVSFKYFFRRCFSILAAIVLVQVIAAGTAFCAAPARASRQVKDAQKSEFASFIDGFFAGLQKEWQVPGLVFVAVKDGEVIYMKGYGYANVEDKIPVDPEKTLFRAGSVSKIITAASLLQLAEKGRLDLDANVNEYLRKSKLPETFSPDITLRHLLSHTAGLDGRELETYAPASADERKFANRLPSIMPGRYAPPGEFYSYSNLGYALVGSIVERYSRQPFYQAVEKRIFQPLGMTRSSFILKDSMQNYLAQGYDASGNRVGISYYYDMPAVGLITGAGDMAVFMMAQLAGGRYGKRILSTAYSDGMLRRQFSPHPKIDGAALGYYERTVGGERTLQHSGDVGGFSSLLVLVPERNFGFFFAANSENAYFRDDLTEAIIKRYWPSKAAPEADAADTSSPPVDLDGFYRHNRISRKRAEKAFQIMGPQIAVKAGAGGVSLDYNDGTSPEWWSATDDPYLFARNESGGRRYLFFKFLEAGGSDKVIAMTVRDVYNTYDRLSKFESRPYQIIFISVFAMAAFISFAGLLLGSAINRSKLPWEKGISSAAELWILSLLFWAVQAAFAAGMVFAYRYYAGEYMVFVPYQVKAMFIIPMAGGLLLAWFWFRLLGSLMKPQHHILEKAALLALAAAGTLYMFFIAYFRLLGFMF